MKKAILPLAFLIILLPMLTAQKIKITGSDTILPLSQLEAQEYMKRNIDASLIIAGGGSAIGIALLLEQKTDIAQSARELTKTERNSFKKNNKSIIETIIAWDALALVVHPTNPVEELTHEQLRDIFSGETKNWKD